MASSTGSGRECGRLWTMMMAKILSDEDYGIDVVISRLLSEIEGVVREGRRILDECLEPENSNGSGALPVIIPPDLIKIYGLPPETEYFWVKESVSMEYFKNNYYGGQNYPLLHPQSHPGHPHHHPPPPPIPTSQLPSSLSHSYPPTSSSASFKVECNVHIEEELECLEEEEDEDDEDEEEDEDDDEDDDDDDEEDLELDEEGGEDEELGQVSKKKRKKIKDERSSGEEESSDEEGKTSRKKRSYYYRRNKETKECPYCHKLFAGEFKNFDLHVGQCQIIASYGDVKDGRTCPKCHKRYKRSYLIGRHLDLCQGNIMENGNLWSRDGENGNLFKCERCLKTYKSMHHFAHHLTNCEKKRKSSCPRCGRYFPTQEEMVRHACPRFPGDRQFRCMMCDYTCFYGPQLSKHYTSKHGGKREYCCETCGKLYADPSVLATHRRTHAAPAHKCPECGKAFHRKATLTRHMTMHFSMNLPCETCGKCFSNQLYLNRHRNSQHPPDGIIVTHPCPHCSSSYREKKFLKKHIRDKHAFEVAAVAAAAAANIGKNDGQPRSPDENKTTLGLVLPPSIHA